MGNEDTIANILTLLRRLNANEFTEAAITTGNTLNDVLIEVKHLYAQNIENKKRLTEIIEHVTNFSNGDYSNKLPVTEKEDELDVVCMGLNTFAEELSSNSVNVKAFDDVFNSLISPFFIVDTERHVLTKFNDSTINFFDYDERNMYLIHIADILPEDLIKSIELFTAHKNKTSSLQYTFQKDGKEKFTIINLSKLNSSYQSTLNVAVFVTDVSARVEKEKLIKQKELAENSAKMKEEFLANMSHEIRTPMNAIIGLSRLMSKTGSLNEKQTDYLKAINLNSNNLLGLINDILDYAKIEAGKTELEKRPFNLKDNIETLRNSMAHIVADKGIEFTVKIDEAIPLWIIGDSLRLNQVLLNLISNAIKFTPKGRVALSTALQSLTDETASIKFSVQDTGIGIPEDKLDTIFDSFTQASSETTRKFGGTGLGLAIVKKIVELHGSKIQINSTLGVGTEFYFVVNYPVSVQIQSVDNIGVISTNQFLKILLAEDNEFNRMVAIDTLMDWNPNVVVEVAENGLIAVEKVKDNKYDLVLMDIQMPEMDGHTATQVIRNELKSDVPIVAMTAHASSSEVDRCLKSGMNDYIPKPFDAAQLFEKINNITRAVSEGGNLVAPQPTEQHQADEIKKIVDFEALYSSANGKQERVERMVKMFLNDTPNEMMRLKQFLAESNFDGLRNLAHSLKPKMTYIGLPALTEVAKQIEHNAAERINTNEINNLIGQLTEQVQIATVELKKVLESNHTT